MKEMLPKDDCNRTDKHWEYLKEYFNEYEKEHQMEEFLSNVFLKFVVFIQCFCTYLNFTMISVFVHLRQSSPSIFQFIPGLSQCS